MLVVYSSYVATSQSLLAYAGFLSLPSRHRCTASPRMVVRIAVDWLWCWARRGRVIRVDCFFFLAVGIYFRWIESMQPPKQRFRSDKLAKTVQTHQIIRCSSWCECGGKTAFTDNESSLNRSGGSKLVKVPMVTTRHDGLFLRRK